MTKWTIVYHADEYVENHLAPDEWQIDCDHDAEATRFAIEKISERYGFPPRSSRVTITDDFGGGFENVRLDGEVVGIVAFLDGVE